MRKQLDAECGERLTDDQLLQIVTRRALEPAAAADPPPASQVALMVCPTCKAATADGAGMIADVTPAQLDAAMCDAELLGNVEREPERVRKTITPRLRRQVFSSGPTWDCTTCRTSPCCVALTTLLHEGKLRISGKAPALVYERVTDDD